tara:strand:+ start:1083 stop:1307 length:225 start_codon:yes stop_codon:yes gene_type:complete
MKTANIKFKEKGKEKGYVFSEDDGYIKVSLFVDWKRDEQETIKGKDITEVVSTYSHRLTEKRIDHEITQRVYFD